MAQKVLNLKKEKRQMNRKAKKLALYEFITKKKKTTKSNQRQAGIYLDSKFDVSQPRVVAPTCRPIEGQPMPLVGRPCDVRSSSQHPTSIQRSQRF